METLGFEPKTFRLQTEYSTVELDPHRRVGEVGLEPTDGESKVRCLAYLATPHGRVFIGSGFSFLPCPKIFGKYLAPTGIEPITFWLKASCSAC